MLVLTKPGMIYYSLVAISMEVAIVSLWLEVTLLCSTYCKFLLSFNLVGGANHNFFFLKRKKKVVGNYM